MEQCLLEEMAGSESIRVGAPAKAMGQRPVCSAGHVERRRNGLTQKRGESQRTRELGKSIVTRSCLRKSEGDDGMVKSGDP